MMKKSLPAAVLLVFATFLRFGDTVVAQAPRATPERPRLLVMLSVDQMRYDYLVRFRSLYSSGLKTLIERGAVFSNARYRHANCETGPGHSVLLSGRNAWQSGIVANSWYDASLGRNVNVVEDPTVRTVGGEGRAASPANFIGFTLGDFLKRESPLSKVVGVSTKDRSAILMSGPHGDAAYWFEPGNGRFITSTYYMDALPPWLQAINDRKIPDSYASKTWTRLLDESVYREFAGNDQVATEHDTKDTVFPHVIAGTPGSTTFNENFKRTPWSDELVLEVALGAIDAHHLGGDEATDILAVGFSATDSVGHAWGPDSHEILDQLLRLDRTLGRLFAAIDQRVGPGRTTYALSADHSVMPLVESLQSRGIAAKRVKPADIQAAAMAELAKRFPGARDLVASYIAPDFYLSLESIARQGLRRRDVEQAISDALLATGVVAKVYTAASFASDRPSRHEDPYFDAIDRSYFAPRSPHVIARLNEYTYLTSAAGGTGHGSAYEYDRHVPLVFMGPHIKPGTYDADTAPEAIAPTLGALLGIDYPLQDAGRVLTEMFQPSR